MYLSRRRLLQGSLLSAGLAAGPARAATPDQRKFVFVHAPGGWDPTRVFAPVFGNARVAMEAAAHPATAGHIDFVDHPTRPSVAAFFADWHERAVVVNGLLVNAISHDACRSLALTGATSGGEADWPTRLAVAQADRFVAPHLVIAGPSYAGEHAVDVIRSGAAGQLDGLLSGQILTRADKPGRTRSGAVEALLDGWVAGRAGTMIDGPELSFFPSFAASAERAEALRALSGFVSFTTSLDLAFQAALAVEVLGRGYSRCVSLALPATGANGRWDSHADNDETQSTLFESLFQGLHELATLLDLTPGPAGGTLAEETLVVVWSEMGRAANLNVQNGKDHWPYTSALLFGAGLAGDKVVGAYDDDYVGVGVDPVSGALSSVGVVPTASVLGATLLAAGGLDPGDEPVLGTVLS